ncbi:MAG TPA: hypothetical protein VHY37_09540 [Tepidisphaeraceae bacterium]|jgi:hypothetical protein|nr:hypothetical protein [Tepidisphaeraceae bacterium]
MLDRLLTCTLNFTIVSLVAILAGGSVLCSYGGLAIMLGGNLAIGGLEAGAGIGLAIAAITAARYRNELADRY